MHSYLQLTVLSTGSTLNKIILMNFKMFLVFYFNMEPRLYTEQKTAAVTRQRPLRYQLRRLRRHFSAEIFLNVALGQTADS